MSATLSSDDRAAHNRYALSERRVGVNSRPVFQGLAEPYEFTYPQTLLQAVSLLGLLVGGVGALALAGGLRGGGVVFTFGPFTFVGLLVAFVATLAVHEAVHGAVARALGYRVSFGVTRSAH